MIACMLEELKSRKEYCDAAAIETIYFGGGTPSLLTPEELKRFLSTVHHFFDVVSEAEITLEANPDDCTEENLEQWKQLGINRLSIGVQSFKANDLKWMNRAHTAKDAVQCVQKAQAAGFENLTVDLMYGLPGLTETEWRKHIQTVIDWGVPHISSYCLTVEEHTLLEKRVDAGELKVANDEEQSRQFEMLLDTLAQNGIQQYEISNFSKPGWESRHNGNYWKGVAYLGIGPSAHSFRGASRQWNVANNAIYMKSVENGADYFESEVLSKNDQFNELLLTGLRTVYGVSLTQLGRLKEIDDDFIVKLRAFQKSGWMDQKEDQIFLTRDGRLRADYIAAELFIS